MAKRHLGWFVAGGALAVLSFALGGMTTMQAVGAILAACALPGFLVWLWQVWHG